MTTMTREQVLDVIREAREQGVQPDLRGLDLSDADLSGVDLSHARLACADLRWADLSDADLRWADLSGARMRYAMLNGANLSHADLTGADLTGADMSGADMYGANLHGANLHSVKGQLLVIEGLPSGRLIYRPTWAGWRLNVGCWGRVGGVHPANLSDLIARDDGWPVARGDEVARRRPLLQAALAMCEAHEAAHPTAIADLAHWAHIEEEN